MGRPTLTYDTKLFPDFEYGHVLPPRITQAVIKNKDLRNCLSCAVYMASQIELSQGGVNLRVEPVRSAYLRASLAELVRVEDVLKSLGNTFRLNKNQDPLLHTIKLLRNYQVHIGSHPLSEGSVMVKWRRDEAAYQSFIIDNLDPKELRKLDSSSGYSNEQLEELVKLFEENQRKFGVVQLIYNTCVHVSKMLNNA